MNLGFAVASVFGAALAGALIAVFGALGRAARRRRLVRGDRGRAGASARDLPAARARARSRGASASCDGLEFARDIRAVRTLLVGQALALICFTLVVPIEVIYAKESLGTTSAGFGILLASWGAGHRARQPAVPRLKNQLGLGDDPDLQRRGRASPTSACPGRQTLLVAACSRSLGGAGNGVQWVAVMTALQEATPPRVPGADGRACWSRSARRCRASASCSAARSSRSAPRAPPSRSRARGSCARPGRAGPSPAACRGDPPTTTPHELPPTPRHRRHAQRQRPPQTSTTTGSTIGRRLSRS